MIFSQIDISYYLKNNSIFTHLYFMVFISFFLPQNLKVAVPESISTDLGRCFMLFASFCYPPRAILLLFESSDFFCSGHFSYL